MKRFLIISTVLVLLFSSCAYESSDSGETKSKTEKQKTALFSFVLDDDFVSNVQQSAGISKLNSVTVRIEFTGGYEATDTKNLSFSELLGTSFNFTDIPLNKAFTIKILVYHGSVLKYEAVKENVILEKDGENNLSMMLKSVFDFADETNIVVWNSKLNGYDTSYDLYSMTSPSSSLGSSFATGLDRTIFFFDAPGNIWYPVSQESANGYETKLKSDKGKEIDFSDVLDFNKILQVAFTCARELNSLYAVCMESGDESSEVYNMTSAVYKFPTLLTDNSKKYAKYILSIDDASCEAMVKWPVVYFDGTDEKLYTVSRGMEGLLLFEFDLTDKKDGDTVTGKEILNLSDEINKLANDGYLSVSDLICHEGVIYILVNGRYVESQLWTKSEYETPFKSRGFLLKYDIATGAVKNAGFSSDEITAGDYEKMYCFTSDGKMAYVDEELKNIFLIDGSQILNANETVNTLFPNFISPSSTAENKNGSISKSKFYGPSRIIGLKPKKLIIADDGYALYIDENGAPSYKNVNRIVTVDLESFAISDCKNTTVNFERDISSLKMYASSNVRDDTSFASLGSRNQNVLNEYFTNTNVYVSDESSPKSLTLFYVGLRNGDGE